MVGRGAERGFSSPMSSCEFNKNTPTRSFTTHRSVPCVSIQLTLSQHVQRKLKYMYVKGKNTSHTSHSLHSHAREMQRVPRSQTRIRVAVPRVNPGSEPVQPPRLAGVWTVADTHTGMAWYGMVWYGLGLRLKVSSSPEERSSSSWGRRGGGGGGGGGEFTAQRAVKRTCDNTSRRRLLPRRIALVGGDSFRLHQRGHRAC